MTPAPTPLRPALPPLRPKRLIRPTTPEHLEAVRLVLALSRSVVELRRAAAEQRKAAP